MQRRTFHVRWHIQNRWGIALVESRREHRAVMRVVYPLLPNRMADSEDRAAKHLAAERARVNHRADVGVGEEIHDLILAGLAVDLALRETRAIGTRTAVPSTVSFGRSHHPL